VTQKPALQPMSPEELQKIRQIERACNNQCAIFISSCKTHSMEGCYRASACKCECSLQQDPANADRDAWHRCARRFTELAETLATHNKDKRP
jgi:hypothetical protein